MYLMGYFLDRGIGTAVNHKAALSYYESAAETGDYGGCVGLGKLLLFGVETKVDIPRAIELFRKVTIVDTGILLRLRLSLLDTPR
jgi:TPR repeat protein